MDASHGALTHRGDGWEPAQAGMQGTLPVPADCPRGPRLGAGADLPSHPDLCPSEALGPRTCQMGDVPTILAAPPPQDGEWTLVISDGGHTVFRLVSPRLGRELATHVLGETICTYAEHKHMLMTGNYTPYL